MKLHDSFAKQYSVYLPFIFILVSSISCTINPSSTPVPSSATTSFQPSQQVQPSVSQLPEIISWFKPAEYLGVKSPDCKPPRTDLTNLPSSSFQCAVDLTQTTGTLNHELWANLMGDPVYRCIGSEDSLILWELIRQTGVFQYVRAIGYFSDGFSKWQIDTVKKLLQEGKLPVDQTGRTIETSGLYWGCRIYSEDGTGKPLYNFWHLDSALDIYLSSGLKPVIHCDFMPDALSEDNKTRGYEGGLINPPKDYGKWRDLIYNTIKHCIERYGVDEVRSWYFDMWNEPDLDNGAYFIQNSSTLSNYLKMYDYFADGAKAADPKVKVGGPAIAYNVYWLKSFLEHCSNGTNYVNGKKGAPLDFISWHQYGNINDLINFNRTIKDTIKQFPLFTNLPTLQTEWGQFLQTVDTLGKRTVDNVNCPEEYTSYEAARLCKFIDMAITEPDRQPKSFFRAESLTAQISVYRYLAISYQGHLVPMPVLNAYLLLIKLGNERLELTGSSTNDNVHGFATRTPNGVQVLVYNFNEKDTKSEGRAEELNLTIKNIPATWKHMRRYQIDEKNSNAWSDSTVLSTASSMMQLIRMENNSKLKIIEQTDTLEKKDGRATFRLNLPPSSVSLVVVGEEITPSQFNPSPHIAQILREEAVYKAAKTKLDFEQLVSDSFQAVKDKSSNNPYSIWGQKALYALLEIAKLQKDGAGAEKIRVHLLTTTLGDIERFLLLNERMEYLQTTGNKDEMQKVTKELQDVRSKLDYYANWSNWAKFWGN